MLLIGESASRTVLGKRSFDRKGDVTAPGYVVYKGSKGSYDYAQ